MACPAVSTGGEFLARALAHIDCQAQIVGSFGFQSLASAGSPAAIAVTGLLTLFVAIYGIRLLFGSGDEPRSLINAVLFRTFTLGLWFAAALSGGALLGRWL